MPSRTTTVVQVVVMWEGYSSSCELIEGVHGPCPSYDATRADHACLESPPRGRGHGRRALDRHPPGGRRGLDRRGRRPAAGRARPARPAGCDLAGWPRRLHPRAVRGPSGSRGPAQSPAQPQRERRLQRGAARWGGGHGSQLADGDPMGTQQCVVRVVLRAHQCARRAHQAGPAPGGGGRPGRGVHRRADVVVGRRGRLRRRAGGRGQRSAPRQSHLAGGGRPGTPPSARGRRARVARASSGALHARVATSGGRQHRLHRRPDHAARRLPPVGRCPGPADRGGDSSRHRAPRDAPAHHPRRHRRRRDRRHRLAGRRRAAARRGGRGRAALPDLLGADGDPGGCRAAGGWLWLQRPGHRGRVAA